MIDKESNHFGIVYGVVPLFHTMGKYAPQCEANIFDISENNTNEVTNKARLAIIQRKASLNKLFVLNKVS